MVAVGMAVVWAGYALGIWGYCLVQGYDVTFTDVFRTTWPGATALPPSGGHKLGTIIGHAATTNPGQGL